MAYESTAGVLAGGLVVGIAAVMAWGSLNALLPSLAVGETGEDVQHIRDKAIEIMRRPVQGAPLPWGPWTGDKVRRVVALGSSAPSSDCCAAMSLVRPGKDICLVPEDPTGANCSAQQHLPHVTHAPSIAHVLHAPRKA